MRKTFSALGFMFFLHSFCLCQDLLDTVPLKLTNKSSTRIAVNQVGNDFYFSFLDVGNLYRFYFNPGSGKLLSLTQPINSNFLPWEDKSVILYSLSENYNTINIVSDDFSKKIYVEKINFRERTIRAITHYLPKKEIIIGITSVNKNVYIISHEKETNAIKFFIVTENESFFVKEVDLSYFLLPGETKISDEIWNSCKIITNFSISNPEILAARIKIYVYPEMLRITDNSFYNYTKILNVSLPDFTITKKEYFERQTVKTTSNEAPSTSSFIWKNYLIQGLAFADTLKISFLDLVSNHVVNEIGISRTDTIAFKNSPVYQEGGGTIFSSSREAEIKKTSQFLRKISSTNFALGINEISDDKAEMIIGSYKELSMPTMSIGVGVNAPSIYNIGYLTKWSKATYFRSLINSKTLEHIPGDYFNDPTLTPGKENLFKKEKVKIELTTNYKKYAIVYMNETLSVYHLGSLIK